MSTNPRNRTLVVFGLAAGAVALFIAATRSLLWAVVAGLVVAVVGAIVARSRPSPPGPENPGRRRFLAGAIGIGIAFVAGGAAIGRVLRRAARPNPEPVIEEMATAIGSESMELMVRGNYPGRSGELQLVLQPFNTSNYADESRALHPDDPRTSHSLVWMYAQRVPIVIYAPGLVSGGRSYTERVSLADLAPTTAWLLGGTPTLPDTEGSVLPDDTLARRDPFGPKPKVVVTFVIDGGGWNVLEQWPDAWPNLKALMSESALYRNAIHGSFPAVTACAHATIGTGMYPRTHGISGHNVRVGDHVVKAYGVPGRADPGFILSPTLADAWSEATDYKAWIGEIGYQIWHLGMIGKGGTNPLGDRPVAIYWNELEGMWASQNPDLYRMPSAMPDHNHFKSEFEAYRAANPALIDDQFDLAGGQKVCCSPPIIKYQGDVIESTFDSENVGRHEATDLLYINFKSPDYTGHIYNMLDPQEEVVLRAVDEEIGRVRRLLDERFAPGEYVLIVTADHGQCPLPNSEGGVRVDPIQLGMDIDAEFATGTLPVVHEVAPSEVFLDRRGLADTGAEPADIAAWLRDYTYAENIGPYVKNNAIQADKLGRRDFAAVMPSPFLQTLEPADMKRFGPGRYPDADPTGIPAAPAGAAAPADDSEAS